MYINNVVEYKERAHYSFIGTRFRKTLIIRTTVCVTSHLLLAARIYVPYMSLYFNTI